MFFGYININKIKIKTDFLRKAPKTEKLNNKVMYYLKHFKFEQPIVIDKNNYLIDGYTTYILAREMGYKHVKVKRQRV